MHLVISIASVAVVCIAAAIFLRFGKLRLSGSEPVALFTFISILFTSDMDVGLIMFPLAEFPLYETDPAYGLTNPLAVIFGSWGFLIWTCYFVTTLPIRRFGPKARRCSPRNPRSATLPDSWLTAHPIPSTAKTTSFPARRRSIGASARTT